MEWESGNLNSELLDCHFIFYNCISLTSSKILSIYKIRSWRFLLCTHSRSCLTILQTLLLLPKDVLCPYTTSFRKTTFHQESSPYRSLDHSWRFNAKEVSCEYLVHRPLNFCGIFRSFTWPFLCLLKSCISFLFTSCIPDYKPQEGRESMSKRLLCLTLPAQHQGLNAV